MICSYFESTKKSGDFLKKRKQQNKNWLYETIEERLKSDFFQNESVIDEIENFVRKVIADEISPFSAAEQLIGMSKKSTMS